MCLPSKQEVYVPQMAARFNLLKPGMLFYGAISEVAAAPTDSVDAVDTHVIPGHLSPPCSACYYYLQPAIVQQEHFANLIHFCNK